MKTLPTVRVETIIAASRQAVWDVLVDFARYPEWNPFTVRVETSGRIGAAVKMDVMLGGKPMKMRERMRVYEPLRRVGWGLHIGSGWLLDCTRVQELEELSERETRYVCHESFRGLSVPLFFKRYERPMLDGFDAAAKALAQRVLQLEAAGSVAAASERLG
jgi:hypothetical protein